MIIHPPEIKRSETEFEIRAQIETKRHSGALWFRFPANCEKEIAPELDPFVVSLLLLAMQTRENVDVRGSISRTLLVGLNEYQRRFHGWFPDRFHLIEVNATEIREDKKSHAGDGAAFSGGVDSFYTWLSLLGRVPREEKGHLTHAFFMAGFDMPLNLTNSIGELSRSYSALMHEKGIRFVSGSTNVRAFVNSIDWTNAHGPALAATALFFRRVISRFYVPSSYTLGSSPKWGTHPELDNLLSTESLQFIHHGASANRVEKLAAISKAPESFARLRVCWIQNIGLQNCGNCEKCLRTMAALEILKSLPRFITFKNPSTLRERLRSLKLRTHSSRVFANELMKEARMRGAYGIWFDLAIARVKRLIFRIKTALSFER